MGDILITATASTGKLNLRKDARDFTEISDTTDIVGCIIPVIWQQPLRLFHSAHSPYVCWDNPWGWSFLTCKRSCLGISPLTQNSLRCELLFLKSL